MCGTRGNVGSEREIDLCTSLIKDLEGGSIRGIPARTVDLDFDLEISVSRREVRSFQYHRVEEGSTLKCLV